MSQEDFNRDQKEINKELFSHAKIANEEMGIMKIDMAVLKTDVGYIKRDIAEIKPKLDQIHGTIRYWLGGLAVVMFVVTLLMKFL